MYNISALKYFVSVVSTCVVENLTVQSRLRLRSLQKLNRVCNILENLRLRRSVITRAWRNLTESDSDIAICAFKESSLPSFYESAFRNLAFSHIECSQSLYRTICWLNKINLRFVRVLPQQYENVTFYAVFGQYSYLWHPCSTFWKQVRALAQVLGYPLTPV